MSSTLDAAEKKRALVAIRSLKQRLDAAERRGNSPIAITGMACRLPGNIRTPGELWDLLAEGRNAVSEVTLDAWNVSAFAHALPDLANNPYFRFKGVIPESDRFDPAFFRISPREASALDPQQRLLLEVSWEALENASVVPAELAGTKTGVFVGLSTLDYGQISSEISSYAATGNALSTAAGRISYTLGLRGPCVPVDTACSSSLVSICLAVQSLRAGASDVALAGGVNLLLSPVVQQAMSALDALSPTGRCRSFDARADGIVRSEGCGMVVLKRLDDAQRDGDRVLGVIVGAAMNHDGQSNGLTAPSGGAQQDVIREALRQAGLQPNDIDYVEAHGTGTPLGDPIEIGALDGVFGSDRDPETPLGVGSLKTNLGHMEAASGVGSLLKVLLSLRHESIPKTLHLQTPNPHIPWEEIPVSVVRDHRPWPRSERVRRAGISAFGFGGTNAHLVVEEPPESPSARRSESSHHLLLVSAQTAESLKHQATRYADFLEATNDSTEDVCATAALHRTHFTHRAALVGESRASLVEQLRQLPTSPQPDDRRRKIAFLVPGTIPEDDSAHRDLLKLSDAYRAAWERASDAFASFAGGDVVQCTESFARSLALHELWSSLGVRPEYVLGQGAGEYLAGHIAGVFDLESAVRLALARHRALASLGNRAALVVQAPWSLVESALPDTPHMTVAAFNGPDSCVVTGPSLAVDELASRLQGLGARVQPLRARADAPASSLDAAAVAEFREVVLGVEFARPRLRLVSSSDGYLARPDAACTAEYWVNQLASPARIEGALRTLHRNGATLLVELGERASLVKVAKSVLGDEPLVIAALDPARPVREGLLRALAILHQQHVPIRWTTIHPSGASRSVDLPTYAFARERHWIEAPASSHSNRGVPTEGKVGVRLSVAGLVAVFEASLGREHLHDGHQAARDYADAVAQELFDNPAARVDELEFEVARLPDDALRWQLVVHERSERRASFTIHFSTKSSPHTFEVLARGTLENREAAKKALAGRPDASPAAEASDDAYVVVGEPGQLESLSPQPAERVAPNSHEVELRVLATGLNFGDVLNALGLHPGGARPLGSDCAAIVERVGASIPPSMLRVGDEVVASAPGSLGRYVTVDASLVVKSPSSLTPSDAATLPTAFVTATLALRELARLRRGQRVLIHAAAGGVGSAAVQIAKRAGAVVLATASPDKWPALREMGVEHVMSSRSLDFAEEVMTLTDGGGVDVVLNSLSGEFIEKGLGVVAAGGHFLELGKRDVWAPDRVAAAYPSLRYHLVDLGALTPQQFGVMLGEAVSDVATGRLQALSRTTFPLKEVGSAFHHMARAKHVGKVVIEHPVEASAAIEARSVTCSAHSTAIDPSAFTAEIAGLSSERVAHYVEEVVRTTVARILGFAEETAVDRDKGFADLGMDSLMAVELRTRLETRIGRALSATIAFDYPSVSELSSHLLEVLGLSRGTTTLAAERKRTTPGEKIAIIGASCRLPGGVSNLDDYWELLRDGVHAVTEVPRDRWDTNLFYDPDPEKPSKTYSRWGAYLDDVKGFDAGFFGISPREAEVMDPQQRILLEVAWEALENGNLLLPSLRDGRTGVFVGVGENEYRFLTTDISNPYLVAGNMSAVAAGRLSHALGLQGPAIALQTACSSALVALNLAVQSLRSGESNVALAGGIGLILTAYGHIGRAKLRALAADGRCKTFDHSADGYVPGEGCGFVVLKRLEDAERDGDRILGVIRGTAVNHDGASSGLTVPNGPAQRFVIAEALRDAKVNPASVDYVETHGTGTPLGDPIEVQALDAVYSAGRSLEQPLLIGSVKTNLGHLEPAAGIASLLKVVLALRHRELPRHLHFTHPNELIPWDELSVEVVTNHRAWPAASSGRRLAGVSAFGMSGTNAHVIVEEPPPERRSSAEHRRDQHLLVLSAKTERSLSQLARRYATYLRKNPSVAIGDVCWTAATRRSPFRSRLTLAGRDHAELAEGLLAYAEGRHDGNWHTASPGEERGKVAFLFTGQGDQHVGMGRELYESEPSFRAAMKRCDAAIRNELGESILPLLLDNDPHGRLNQTRFTQPALFALEYSLTELWKSWGVLPEVVMGHSFGEYVAACVASVFTVEDALKLLVFRGTLVEQRVPAGAMATIPLPPDQVAHAIRDLSSSVSIAAYNGVDHAVISGTAEGIREACELLLRSESVRAWPLSVSHAFHSPMMDAVLDEFERFASRIPMSPPQLDIVSNLTGELIGDEMCDARYWRRHMRDPVQFARGARTLQQDGARVLVEIGPQPTLLSMTSAVVGDDSLGLFASLRKGHDACQQMLTSLGSLWARGVEVDLDAAMRPFSSGAVELPSYTFDRTAYWVEDPEIHRVLSSNQFDSISDYFYELTWQRLDPKGGQPPRKSGKWLILADRPEEAGRVVEALARQDIGSQVVCGKRETWAEVLSGDEGFTDVLCLWGLEQHVTDDSTAREVWSAAAALCEPLADLLRACGSPKNRLGVWLATRGVQPVGESATSPSASALWGMGRVFSLERPDLWGGIVDLPSSSEADEFDLLIAAVCNAQEEDQLAVRDGHLHAARLVERRVPVESTAPTFDGNRPYLITGGTGAIGLHVAGWLVAHGARQLVLTSRSGMPPREAWDEASDDPRLRHQIESIRRLEAAGAEVQVAAVDVSDEAKMAALLKPFAQSLAGVFHIAGVAALGPLAQLDRKTLDSHLLPKVRGTWNLHRLTREMPLDHFVVFSSVSAMWGGFAQGPYAASNHFMDSVIHHRRQLGLPGLAINWAEWAEGGLGSPEAIEYLRRIGVLTMTTSSALEALTRAISLNRPQITIGKIDWTTFKPVYEAHRRRRLFDQIVVDEGASASRQSDESGRDPGWFLETHAGQGGPALARALRDLVLSETARVLRLRSSDQLDPRTSFVALGMDSLMAVELRNTLGRALGLSLPTTAVMRNPNVDELSAMLREACADQFADGVSASCERIEASPGSPPLEYEEIEI